MTSHVLFVCTHNAARSVLAEGMLNHLAARETMDRETLRSALIRIGKS